MNQYIYLDNNATTPLASEVWEKMQPYLAVQYGNPASATHSFGWTAADAVEKARHDIAALLNADAAEIFFAPSATIAINVALVGFARMHKHKGNHIIAIKTEHQAVLLTLNYLQAEGFEITLLDVGRDGLIDMHQLANAQKSTTILLVAMMVNNETGVMQPMDELGNWGNENHVPVFSDACQAMGKVPIDVQRIKLGLMVANAHKLYGPKGAAILYCSRKNPRVKLSPLLAGGGQEAGLFPGTLNVPAIVGMAAAFQLASNRFWDDSALISPIRTRFEQQLEDQQLVFINGSTKSRIYTTTNLLSRTISASQLIKKLPQYCFSVGSACTSSKEQPSHVLTAMGLTKTEVLNSFRISFGRDSIGINLENMISDFIAALKSEN